MLICKTGECSDDLPIVSVTAKPLSDKKGFELLSSAEYAEFSKEVTKTVLNDLTLHKMQT